jgi:A/G-specific adenine glycosylase
MNKEDFQQTILNWYEKEGRDLPWRRTQDLYKIMVSEFMLQQTQVSRVEKKFSSFLQRLPTVEALALASSGEVITEWSGLGYNRRAIFLQRSAQKALKDFDGKIPCEQEVLIMFPGIGPYMSRSILIFGQNQDLAAVDTNIRRIFIAHDFAHEDMDGYELQEVADELLPIGRSRDWHNALMDYGSLVMTSRGTGIRPVTRQSKFEYSFRWYRSKVVKHVIEHGHIGVSDLGVVLEKDSDFVRKVVVSLEKDQLVRVDGEVVYLP